MAQLTDCDVCGSLAMIAVTRPAYEDSAVKSAVLVGMEEDIYCPKCGLRTQAQPQNCPA